MVVVTKTSAPELTDFLADSYSSFLHFLAKKKKKEHCESSQRLLITLVTKLIMFKIKVKSTCAIVFLEAHIKREDAQRGARTHDPEIKSLMLYRLS